MRQQTTKTLIALWLVPVLLLPELTRSSVALPPPEDQPEEVLRSQIITGARSPIDGKPLTAAEYAELQQEIQTSPPAQPQVSRQVRKVVNLLKLRKFIKTFLPFIPIK